MIHELVEIDEMLKLGVEMTKEAIAKHPDKVGAAHLRAARAELMVAKAVGATDHIRERCADLETWCMDKTMPESRREEFRALLEEAKADLQHLTTKTT